MRLLRTLFLQGSPGRTDLSIWLRSCALAVGTIVALFAFEWLFQVTRPSHFIGISWRWKALVLFSSPLLALVVLLPLFLITLLAVRLGVAAERVVLPVLAVSAGVAVATAWMMVSNFTTTVFGVSVFEAQRFVRLGLALLLVVSLVVTFRGFRRRLSREDWPLPPRGVLIVVTTVLVMTVVARAFDQGKELPLAPDLTVVKTPNILLIGSDGIDASRMSIYGGLRATTPELANLASDALVAENAFSNGNFTAGSTIALLTGRLPVATGVFHHADLLRGDDVTRHLPGILRDLGYDSGQFALVDAFHFNMKRSFRFANGRSAPGMQHAMVAISGPETALFVAETWRRHASLVAYLLHPPVSVLSRFGLWEGGGAFEEKRAFDTRDLDLEWGDPEQDDKTVARAIQFVRTAHRPFFVHTFLTGTHGPLFTIHRPRHSAGSPSRHWDPDRLDDSIHEADARIGRLLQFLRDENLYEDTIIVFYSDHGSRWNNLARIPIVVRFPGGDHAGRLSSNAQLIDIAPTILDYIGARSPRWMDGASLIRELPPCRPIVTVAADRAFYEKQQGGSPVGQVAVVQGSIAAVAELRSGSLSRVRVSSSDARCPDAAPEASRRAAELRRMFGPIR